MGVLAKSVWASAGHEREPGVCRLETEPVREPVRVDRVGRAHVHLPRVGLAAYAHSMRARGVGGFVLPLSSLSRQSFFFLLSSIHSCFLLLVTSMALSL
jgi:hypothetical protein